MAELDGYREEISEMQLGDLMVELVDLKVEGVSEEDKNSKAEAMHTLRIREVRKEINKREVRLKQSDSSDEDKKSGKVTSLKGIL